MDTIESNKHTIMAYMRTVQEDHRESTGEREVNMTTLAEDAAATLYPDIEGDIPEAFFEYAFEVVTGQCL